MTARESDVATLPGTGVSVTRVAFGGHPVGGHGWGVVRDDQRSRMALRAAVESGVTFFDTADVYGLGVSEAIHAEVLGPYRRAGENLVIATKGGVAWDDQGRTRRDSSAKYLRRAVEGSLRRLQVDCIDLYYLHWPDGVTPVADSVEELSLLRQEGKIRTIGLSNVSAEEIRRSADAGIAAVQVKGNLLELDDLLGQLAAVRLGGALVVCYSGLADGLLTGRIGSDSEFNGDDHRARYPLFQPGVFEDALGRVELVVDAARSLGRTPAQVAQRCLLDGGLADAVLVGSSRPEHVRENAGAMGWTLPDDTLNALLNSVPLSPHLREGDEFAGK